MKIQDDIEGYSSKHLLSIKEVAMITINESKSNGDYTHDGNCRISKVYSLIYKLCIICNLNSDWRSEVNPFFEQSSQVSTAVCQP